MTGAPGLSRVSEKKIALEQWGSAGFSADDRLLKGHEFRYMKENGRSVVGRFIVLSHAPAPDDKRRLGVIVTKRYNKRAVRRNRAFRLVRESYRLIKDGISDKKWIIVIARKALHNRQAGEVQQELIRLLKQEGLLEKSIQSDS